MYDVDEYEKAYYTVETGDIKLIDSEIYKVIGFFEDPSTFKTTIKIRSTGVFV